MMTLGQRKLFAAELRTCVWVNQPFRVAYEPGDGTHYDLFFCPIGPSAVYSSGNRAASLLETGRWLMADAAVNRRAMTVDLSHGHYTDPSYLVEKGFMRGAGSAVVAELLNLITGVEDMLLDNMRSAWPLSLWDRSAT